MLFWGLCGLIHNKLSKTDAGKSNWYRRFTLITLILLSLVIVASIVFNEGYYIIDHNLFGISDMRNISYLNPEIFKPSDVFETFRINPELLFGFILVFILVYGTHVFIASVRNTKELELIAMRQKKESITAQYAALKNQIDPHFFFNSLSVLSSLVTESTELSENYISHLSKHYRYILETPAERLVAVERELEHLESYFYLIQLRYPDMINLSLQISENTRTNCRILPHSLIMLVENAVKHNNFRKDSPLVIEIKEDEKYLIIRNNKNKRNLVIANTGIGLQNIIKRYALESNRDVIIEDNDLEFAVKLPKIIEDENTHNRG
jgi:hypothetical protein